MDSIVTYIEREQRTFTESPVNAVDSLVLSSLCYFNFDKLVLKPGAFHGLLPIGYAHLNSRIANRYIGPYAKSTGSLKGAG